MSVNTSMTAIADKIRALLGTTGKMGLSAMATNLTTLKSNIDTALSTIADKGVEVPSGATAGNLAALIAQLPDAVTYTNMLKKAVDTSKNPYNSGKGWKADTYLSFNGLTESSSTNYDVTGFIPAKAGDIIRLKNVQLCKTVNGNSKCIVACVKSDFSALASSPNWLKEPSSFTAAWNAVTNADGTDVVQFSVPTANSATAYIRLCCGSLTDKSIITINEEIK